MHKEEKITLIEARSNLGYGKANNLGAKHAKGEYLLVLNPDISVEPDTLSRMVHFLDERPDIGLLGPKLYFFNGQIQDSCRRFMRPMDLVIKRTFLSKIGLFKKRVNRYLMTEFDHNNIQDVDFVTGACFLTPQKVFDEVGGFDERYFLFMEDADLCKKMWNAGYKVVYFAEAKALHYHKRLSGGNIFKLLLQPIFWIHLKAMIKYFWKWKGQKHL
jgi:hypothetical protein